MCGALLAAARLLAQPPSTGPFDLVIANGRVMDPESNTDAVRAVGITGGIIRAVSERPLEGRVTIDARGLIVAPGFIDLHQHGQTPADYLRKAADGVTTALELEVGAGDIDAWYGERAGKAAINYGASVGHIPVRMAVMKDGGAFLPSGPAASQEATALQLVEIKAGLSRGLARGAIGVGLGVAYTPQAARTEILDVFEVAGAVGAPVYVHMRGGDPIAAFEEVLALAAATGAPLHVVHAQSSGGRQTPALLQLLGRARGRGIDVTTEMYPYTASQTRIESALYDDWERYTRRAVSDTALAGHRRAADSRDLREVPQAGRLGDFVRQHRGSRDGRGRRSADDDRERRFGNASARDAARFRACWAATCASAARCR